MCRLLGELRLDRHETLILVEERMLRFFEAPVFCRQPLPSPFDFSPQPGLALQVPLVLEEDVVAEAEWTEQLLSQGDHLLALKVLGA